MPSSPRYAAVYTGQHGPVSALFDAPDAESAVETVRLQGNMWFVMARDDLRLARAPAFRLGEHGFRPLETQILPDFTLWLRETGTWRSARKRPRHPEQVVQRTGT